VKPATLPPYLREAIDALGADAVRKTLESAVEGERMVERFLAGGPEWVRRKPVPGLDKNDIVGFLQYLTIARDKYDFIMGAAIGAGCVLRAGPKRQAAVEQYLRSVFAGAVGRLVEKKKEREREL